MYLYKVLWLENPMKIWAIVLAGLAPLCIAQPTMASDYPAKNLGGSAYLTWRFSRQVNTENLTLNDNLAPQQVGYACWSRDTLAGMARSAHMYRYKIMAMPFSSTTYLEPMQGVVIRPEQNSLIVKSVSVPAPEVLKDLPRNASGEWFQSDMEGEAFEKACVDGGIEAGLKYLSAQHGKAIASGNDRSSAKASGTQAALYSQDSSSRINIRDNADVKANARHIGYSGDRVEILETQEGGDGNRWYRVKFQASGATGWVRGDFVRVIE
jgi:Bacterial SH3 domain